MFLLGRWILISQEVQQMSSDVTGLFLRELKQYNGTNFRTLLKVDLSCTGPEVCKAFSSVVTRYFIFLEKHPEISNVDANMLYYRLKIDTVARFFSQYPAASLEDLKPFQREIRIYVEEFKGAFMDESA